MLTSWPSSKQAFQSFRSIPSQVARNRLSDLRRAEWKIGLLCLILIASGATGFSATGVPDRVDLSAGPQAAIPQGRELRGLGRASAHMAEFSPVSASPLAMPKCASVRPPEALLTPDPLLPPQEHDLLVGVSFIIGSDGHVHSAFVTYSGGDDGDQAVLRAVRAWRYRPALCNGVPTDSEARVRFTAHE